MKLVKDGHLPCVGDAVGEAQALLYDESGRLKLIISSLNINKNNHA